MPICFSTFNVIYLLEMSKRQFKTHASSSRADLRTHNPLQSAFTPSVVDDVFDVPQLSNLAEPPDLTSIRDPRLVVLLKNLLKRDVTTKAKALDEIHEFISSTTGGLDESFVEAWVGFSSVM